MNAAFLLDPYVSSRLCLALLHSLWQVALLAAACWGIDRCWRGKSLEASYTLYVAALILSLAALPVTFVWIDVAAPVEVAVAVPISAPSTPAPNPQVRAPLEIGAVAPSPSESVSSGNLPHAAPATKAEHTSQEARPSAGRDAWLRSASWLAFIYAGGVVLMLTRLFASAFCSERLGRTATPITQGPLVEALQVLSNRWSTCAVPALAWTRRIAVPQVVGLWKPTILLPASAVSGLTTAELEWILAHELAHVRRHDMWINLLQRWAEAVLFFNPALWFLSRRASALREYCCDEWACQEMPASEGEPRLRYAQVLLRIVELARPEMAKRSSELAAMAASGRAPSELRRRLARLVGQPLREPMPFSRRRLLSLSVLTLVLLLIPLMAKSQPGPDEADKPENVLRFPDDRTGGVVFSRPAGLEGYRVGFGFLESWYEGWEQIAPARGEVEIPPGHHVRLDVSKAASKDLSFLREIPPDGIHVLNLEGTDVDDEQLRHVGRLTGLRMLNLEETRITDRGIQHLANLRQLQRLDLSAFGVHRDGFGVGDESMAIVAQLPALESIALRLTKVTDAGMEALAKCKSLKSIGIEGTPVTDNGLEYLLDLPRLVVLGLGVYDEGASITDEGLRTVGRMAQLKSLSLSGTPVTNAGLEHLSGLTELESLDIDETQATEAGLAHLAPLQKIERLRLFDTVTDVGAKHLSKLKNLKRISANLDLSDKGVAELAKLPHLEQLMLSDQRITDVSLRHIARMPELKTLWFQDCQVSDQGLELLRGSPSLESLLISRTQMTTASLEPLSRIPNLRILSLNLSSEADEEPDWRNIAEFKQLEQLRLSGPSFRNADFAYLKGLVQLKWLDLQLDDPVNDEAFGHLKNLKHLTQLDVENTVITDQALTALSGMDKLEYLTISGLITDTGLRALRGMKSLRLLQIASPHLTEEGLSELAAGTPALQDINRFDYRLGYDEVTPSNRDAIWREGTPEERVAKDLLENLPPPELSVWNWINRQDASLNLASLRGKVVLVKFWGTWSRPSKTQLPRLKELYQQHHPQGLEIVGIHSSTIRQDVPQFLADEEIPWPVAIDFEDRTVQAWQADGYPDYYLIDRFGNLRMADIFEEHLEPAIRTLLSEGGQGAANSNEVDNVEPEIPENEYRLNVIGPDGQPVPHVEVEIRTRPVVKEEQIRAGRFLRSGRFGAVVETDQQGQLAVRFDDPPDGLRFGVKQPGFAPYWAEWTSNSPSSAIPREFTMPLSGAWSLGGIVVDENGQPVQGARVRPNIYYQKRPGDAQQLGVGGALTTKADGKWRFDSVPESVDHVSAEIHHPDFQPGWHDLTRAAFELAPGEPPRGKIQLQRGLTVSGTVTDQAGQPVEGALVRTKFTNDVRKATTDAQGVYRLTGCRPSMARIVVSAPGQALDMREVRVDPEMEPVNFVLDPGGKIRVRVVDEQGNGIPKARIFFQRWRGMIDYFEFDHVDDYADENGVWEWNEAPLDEFRADICRPGGLQLKREPLVARDEEYVFSPPPPLIVSGSVIDAHTKQPIQEFRVTPGIRNPDPGIRFDWISGDSYVASGGEYEIRFTNAYLAHLVRIEADGYQVAMSRDIQSDEGEVRVDFELEPAEDIAGIIETVAGKPAAHAKLALGVAGSQISIEAGVIDDSSTDATRLDADAEGRFRFPARTEPFHLVITHEAGFAYFKSKEKPIPSRITLTPWARAEGTFRVGPEAAENVVLSWFGAGIHSYGDDVPNIFTHHEVATGKDGRFMFDRVFPGTGRIGRRIRLIHDEGATEVTSSQRVSAEFVAGKTTRLDLGGTGRLVIGTLAPSANHSSQVLWNFVLLNVRADLQPPTRPTPLAEARNDREAYQKWWDAWRKTPEGQVWFAAYTVYQQMETASPYIGVTVDRDGSFRIDDMPPGNYVMSGYFRMKDAPGKLTSYPFSVPPPDGEYSAEPLDLGTITLEPR